MLNLNYQKTTTELNELFDIVDQKLFNHYFMNLREYNKDKVIVTVQTKGKHHAYGWITTQAVWVDVDGVKSYEINISAEYLDRTINETLSTLIHEMCHLYNITKGIQDCSRKGVYHNKAFKDTALQYGLIVEKDNKHGWSSSKLSDSSVELFKDIQDKYQFISRQAPLMTTSTTTKEKKNVTYTCPVCGQSFSAKRGLLLKCELCDVQLAVIEL